MPEHVLTRRSYEAEVAAVPLDPRARSALGGAASRHLAGITVAPPPAAGALTTADMVVLVSCDLAAVSEPAVKNLARAARDAGAPLGTIIIAPDRRWTEPDARRGAVLLREASDTVVVLGDLDPAIAFLQVLRGGSRNEASAAGV